MKLNRAKVKAALKARNLAVQEVSKLMGKSHYWLGAKLDPNQTTKFITSEEFKKLVMILKSYKVVSFYPTTEELKDLALKKGKSFPEMVKHLGIKNPRTSMDIIYKSKYNREILWEWLQTLPDFVIDDSKKHLFDTTYIALRRIKKGITQKQLGNIIGYSTPFVNRSERSADLSLEYENLLVSALDPLPDAHYTIVVPIWFQYRKANKDDISSI